MKSTVTIRDCRDVVALLTEYLEGGLAPGDVSTLEAHLARCSACGGYLESLRKTRDAMRALATREVPEDCRRELRALLDAARRGARRGTPHRAAPKTGRTPSTSRRKR